MFATRILVYMAVPVFKFRNSQATNADARVLDILAYDVIAVSITTDNLLYRPEK